MGLGEEGLLSPCKQDEHGQGPGCQEWQGHLPLAPREIFFLQGVGGAPQFAQPGSPFYCEGRTGAGFPMSDQENRTLKGRVCLMRDQAKWNPTQCLSRWTGQDQRKESLVSDGAGEQWGLRLGREHRCSPVPDHAGQKETVVDEQKGGKMLPAEEGRRRLEQ